MRPHNSTPPHLKKKAVEKNTTNTEKSLVVARTNTADVEKSAIPSPTANDVANAPAIAPESTLSNALVPYGIQNTLSPMEMIQHETVQNLQALLDDAQARLNAANARCDQLQAENEQLRQQLSTDAQGTAQTTPDGRGETLCGYAESEAAEESVVSNGAPAQTDMAVSEKVDTITQILQVHTDRQSKLESATARQEELIQALISQFTGDGPAPLQVSAQKDTVSAIEHRKLVDKMANLEQTLAAIQHSPAQSITPDFQTRIERKIRQQERIDNAPIRADLIQYYEVLSEQIAGKKVGRGTRFEGTEDELWTLRDHVALPPPPPCAPSHVDLNGYCLNPGCALWRTLAMPPPPRQHHPIASQPWVPTAAVYRSVDEYLRDLASWGPQPLPQMTPPDFPSVPDPVHQHAMAMPEYGGHLPAPTSPESPVVCYTPDVTPQASFVEGHFNLPHTASGDDDTYNPVQQQQPPAEPQDSPQRNNKIINGFSSKDMIPFLIKLSKHGDLDFNIYVRFLQMIGSFQTGDKSFEYTCGQVTELLKEAPDLASEFEEFVPEFYSGTEDTREDVSEVLSATEDGFGREPPSTKTYSLGDGWGHMSNVTYEKPVRERPFTYRSASDGAQTDNSDASPEFKRRTGSNWGQPSYVTDDGTETPEMHAHSPQCAFDCEDPCHWQDVRYMPDGVASISRKPSSRSSSPWVKSRSPIESSFSRAFRQKSHELNAEGITALYPGQEEASFLCSCIAKVGLSADDRYKALGIISTLHMGNGSSIPQVNTSPATVATPSQDVDREALHRIEIMLAGMRGRGTAAPNAPTAAPAPDSKDESAHSELKDLRYQMDDLDDANNHLGNRINNLNYRLEKEADWRHRLSQDVGDSFCRSWNLEGKVDGLTSKVNAEIIRRDSAAASETRRMDAWISWLVQKIDGLENKLTGSMNAYPQLDHVQNDKLAAVSKGLNAVQQKLHNEAVVPVRQLQSQVEDFNHVLSAHDSRLNDLEHSLESGDVDQRFVDAELQLESFREDIKALLDAKNDSSIQDIKADLRGQADKSEEVLSTLDRRIGDLEQSVDVRDVNDRFQDADLQLEDLRKEVKTLSGARDDGLINAIEAELKAVADRQSRLEVQMKSTVSETDVLKKNLAGGDVNQRFIDAELHLEDLREKIQTLSEAKESGTTKAMRASLKDLTDRQAYLHAELESTVSRVDGLNTDQEKLRVLGNKVNVLELSNKMINQRYTNDEKELKSLASKVNVLDSSNKLALRNSGDIQTKLDELTNTCDALRENADSSGVRHRIKIHALPARLEEAEESLKDIKAQTEKALHNGAQTIIPILQAKVNDLADRYPSLESDANDISERLASVERSIDSGPVEKRFVDAEVQLEELEQKLKDLSSTKGQAPSKDIETAGLADHGRGGVVPLLKIGSANNTTRPNIHFGSFAPTDGSESPAKPVATRFEDRLEKAQATRAEKVEVEVKRLREQIMSSSRLDRHSFLEPAMSARSKRAKPRE
ncbi:hypothetical protein M409DRAFT_50839 [Zasmidium cellare ATCC 36951]|uniref:Uncharacterized protein n=1 Tax=Zasmidium cellare ATCC 36951 TaxID=1080233 RepID=A0A6A6CZS2_ZASCE|nr:uncharacterized protein M409DRAFT_50839 [Zasmidium cellare ATCC 36951]KAF2171392.1 hypothetical protein M409DRAFT_50839 [Zasmidium cellare ATCC 36951]